MGGVGAQEVRAQLVAAHLDQLRVDKIGDRHLIVHGRGLERGSDDGEPNFGAPGHPASEG